jgi:DNA-binding CsgD family transcriptional regulator
MATPKTIQHALAELRALGSTRLRRQQRSAEAGPLLLRLLAPCKTLGIEERAGGIAVRLQGATDGGAAFSITCILHHPGTARELTTAEQAVAEQLCEGRTLAQIARLRGVSANTVKSQVRQIFRKLNVESRVALVRRMCP